MGPLLLIITMLLVDCIIHMLLVRVGTTTFTVHVLVVDDTIVTTMPLEKSESCTSPPAHTTSKQLL